MLGMIGAMDKEVDALRDAMTDTREEVIGFTRCTLGVLWGANVCLARCGVGKVHAALCAQALLLRYPVDALLNIGVAGALRPSLAIGDAVIARSAVQHDMDTTAFGDPPGLIWGPNIVHIPCDPALTALLRRAAEEASLRYEEGAVATGDQFIVDTKKKTQLAEAFGAAACDMEGAAIAQCSYEMHVPFAACRLISDTRDGDQREYMEKAALACRNEEILLRRFLPLYQAWEEEKHHG